MVITPPAVAVDMDFAALAAECAPWVAPQTMAAIVKTESQFKPLAINVNGGAKLERQPTTKEEAVITAKWLIANSYNIDMGLGQVNSVNLSKTKLSVEDAFDPCKNLAAAATILQWNYESASKHIPGEQAALHAAISAYNTGSFTRGFSNGYVQKVVNNARTATPSVASQNSVIVPIQLVNMAKRESVKRNRPTEGDVSVVKIKAIQSVEDAGGSQLSVYSENKPEQDIMVFR